LKKLLLITFFVLLTDQLTKIYVKTHFEIGESLDVFSWFKIHFLENPGMAYGLHIGKGYIGKILLSIFRLLFIVIMFFWIQKNIKKQKATNYFIIPISLIFAGAIGNLIDSAFYGLIFDTGTIFSKEKNLWLEYHNISKFSLSSPYSFFMGGCVVDMLYFPLFHIPIPQWIPYIGGRSFEFFQPVFNIADTVISIGIGLLILFNRKNKIL